MYLAELPEWVEPLVPAPPIRDDIARETLLTRLSLQTNGGVFYC